MQRKTKSDHFDTISNRFLDPKLVCSEKIRLKVSFLVSDSFSSREPDQGWINVVELVLIWMSIYVPDQKPKLRCMKHACNLEKLGATEFLF